jgi:alpha-L-fucosidase
MTGVILTAKHHDGFCLWPSAFTRHSIASSPFRNGGGDIVRELSDACRAEGLRFGLYLSPWDRHEPSYGDSRRYNEHFKGQLREILTRYGEVFEVWFDGACGEGPNGKRQVYDWPAFVAVVRECQPGAVIFSDGGPDVRWVGNEHGEAGETNWSLLRRDEVAPGYPHYHELTSGHADGTHWVPAECDVSIRPGWYYHAEQDSQVKSLAALVEIYFRSVGRSATLLLNVPVDRRGLLPAADSTRLLEFRRYLDDAFRRDLAEGRPVHASGFRGLSAAFAPSHVTDGSDETYWAADDTVRSGFLELDLGEKLPVNCLLVQEVIRLGQRVEEFSVEAMAREGWTTVARGTTIGYKRLIRFPTVAASCLRLNLLGARACPAISRISAYAIPTLSE